MLLTHEFIPAAELTGFARAALADLPENQFQLRTFLGDETHDDLQFEFTKGGEGLTRAATYRTWDTEAPLTARPGVSKVVGELPPISRKIPVMEYAQLQQRKQEQRINDLILRDAERLVRETAARVELARSSALVYGRVDIDELQMTVDFGRHEDMSPTPGVNWDASGAEPLSDLMDWVEKYRTRNGIAPSVILTSQRIVGLLMRNSEIRSAVYGNAVDDSPNFVSQSSLNTVLQAHGLPAIEVYDAQVQTDNTTAQAVLPTNRVLMLPGDGVSLGRTLWGTTVESLSEGYGIEDGSEPGIVVGSYTTQDPVHLWTKSAAVAMPILGNADMAFSARVVSGQD